MSHHALVRALCACLLISALLPSTATAATVGSTTGEPDRGCGNGVACTVASGVAAPAATTLTSFTLRHSGAQSGDQVAFKTLRETASGYAVVRSTAPVALPASPSATTTTFEIPGGLPIAASEFVGAYVSSAGVRFIQGGSSGAGHGEHAGDIGEGQSGENFWALFSGTTVLLSATDGQPEGGGGGTGPQPGSGETDNGSAEQDATQYCASPTAAPARVRTSSTAASTGGSLRVEPGARAARREWRATVLDRPPSSSPYSEADIVFDRRGRRHVVGKTLNPDRVTYFGPGGRRDVGRAEFSPNAALAILGSGTPVVAWSRSVYETEPAPPGIVGRSHICDVLFLATGPAFEPTPLAVRPENQSGYLFKDVAGDGNVVHAAYNVGQSDQLLYQRGTAAPELLPLTGVRRVRVAAARGFVAVAASNDSSLVVFTRKGTGRWKRTKIATRFGSWDMDLGSDGRPRVAFKSGLFLRLFDGRRVRRTRISADQVALAVDSRRNLHVAFTKVGGPNCFGFITRQTCVSNGIFYLRTNPKATRGRLEVAQRSVGESPALRIAVSGRKVEVAFPQAGGALYVRRR